MSRYGNYHISRGKDSTAHFEVCATLCRHIIRGPVQSLASLAIGVQDIMIMDILL